MAEDSARAERRRWGVGVAVVLVLLALAVTVAIGVFRGAITPSEAVPVATSATSAPRTIYVHVAGAVESPGLYLLAPSSRVVDAIAAAGGFADDADTAGVNLAREVSDGEQLVVPVRGEQSEQAGGGSSGLVNLNSADVALLDTLPGVGPAIAARIIEWRDANGRFSSVDDLLAVSGIGSKMLASLRDLVTV